MNPTLSPKKIAIAAAVMLLLAAVSVAGLLYFSSTLLVKYVPSLVGAAPSISLPFDAAKSLVGGGDSKAKGFGAAALIKVVP